MVLVTWVSSKASSFSLSTVSFWLAFSSKLFSRHRIYLPNRVPRRSSKTAGRRGFTRCYTVFLTCIVRLLLYGQNWVTGRWWRTTVSSRPLPLPTSSCSRTDLVLFRYLSMKDNCDDPRCSIYYLIRSSFLDLSTDIFWPQKIRLSCSKNLYRASFLFPCSLVWRLNPHARQALYTGLLA